MSSMPAEPKIWNRTDFLCSVQTHPPADNSTKRNDEVSFTTKKQEWYLGNNKDRGFWLWWRTITNTRWHVLVQQVGLLVMLAFPLLPVSYHSTMLGWPSCSASSFPIRPGSTLGLKFCVFILAKTFHHQQSKFCNGLAYKSLGFVR